VGHKTHCKLCLVVRSEGRSMKNYAHLGTGNYNPRTAKLYTDLSYFTSRRDITSDVAQLFNTLTGFGRTQRFRNIVVAPFNLHRRIGELIDREAANARDGKPARILAKMNALVDKATIDALYAASQAGVKIDLIIRGVCSLVPGVKGLSESITVRSIVGRFLEHARCFYFENAGGEPLILAGSADWMQRNFFRRVEVLFPIRDAALRQWILTELFPVELRDNDNAHVLDSSGAYRPAPRVPDERPFSAQAYYMADAMKRSEVKG
jgi:polyphosphate kinase